MGHGILAVLLRFGKGGGDLGPGEALVRLRRNSLALRHHFAVHGTGTTIAAVANAGQTAGGHPSIRAAIGKS